MERYKGFNFLWLISLCYLLCLMRFGDSLYHDYDDVFPAESCKDTEFKCKSGQCIPGHWHCDHEDDCSDRSDEDPTVCRE